MTDFFGRWEAFLGTRDEHDRLWWSRNNEGTFKVNSAYKLLNQDGQQPSLWPWKRFGNLKSLSRCDVSPGFWQEKQF